MLDHIIMDDRLALNTEQLNSPDFVKTLEAEVKQAFKTLKGEKNLSIAQRWYLAKSVNKTLSREDLLDKIVYPELRKELQN